MGKLGRFACIFTPMVCTLASLVAVMLLLVSGTKDTVLPQIYYIRLDVREIKIADSSVSAKDLQLKDFYATYMWNYCSGTIDKDNWKTDFCKATKPNYTFDIEQIINDHPSDTKRPKITFPDSVHKVQKAINIVSKFMAACYAFGLIATIVTFVIGWFGLLSRWGSCVTTIFADIAFVALLGASISVTALSYTLAGAFSKAFESFGVEAYVGNQWITTTWVATAFSFAASIFWMMSMCCCSGRRSRVMGEKEKKHGVRVERTPYTYERVASPYMGNSAAGVPMTPYGGGHGQKGPGFEPMRHGAV